MVGGIPTPLKNMKVGWDDYSQTWTNITCSKLPPRYIYIDRWLLSIMAIHG